MLSFLLYVVQLVDFFLYIHLELGIILLYIVFAVIMYCFSKMIES